METPCKGTCVYSIEGRLCIGCGRTLQELYAWTDYTDDERAHHEGLARRRLREYNDRVKQEE